jgi:L-iditol 2-dehydrogenase
VPTVNARNDSFAIGELSDEQAIFIEPLGCSYKALMRLDKLTTLSRSTGVVVGCGAMGLLNLTAARALGVPRLAAVEPNEERRRLALAWGAALALSPAEAEEQLFRSADFVMVGPGHPDVILQSLRYVRAGGAVLLFTPTSTGTNTHLDLGDLYFREISLIPSYSCGPDDTRHAYELIRSRRVQPERLVTQRFRLADIQQAYDTARAGGAALKVVVTFPGGD